MSKKEVFNESEHIPEGSSQGNGLPIFSSEPLGQVAVRVFSRGESDFGEWQDAVDAYVKRALASVEEDIKKKSRSGN